MILKNILLKILPTKTAYAHCDVPCGIYDPKIAQIAAQTVLKMTQLINQMKRKAVEEFEIYLDETEDDFFADDEYEEASGWLTCLEEVFEDFDLVEVNGITMKFIGFHLEREIVPMIICSYNKKRAKITIDSVQFINPDKAQKLWLRAWDKWSKKI